MSHRAHDIEAQLLNSAMAAGDSSDNEAPLDNTTMPSSADAGESADSRNLAGDTSSEEGISFLDLAPELRNNIYQHLIDASPPARLPKKFGAKLLIQAPILLANKQISAEYHSLAAATSPVIETRVDNFNFNHVAAFLNRLPEIDAARLIPRETAELPPRTMRIKIFESRFGIAQSFSGPTNFSPLSRWLNRMQNPEKLGGKVTFEYELLEGSRRPSWFFLGKGVSEMKVQGKDRAVEEYEKMVKALAKKRVRKRKMQLE